MDNVTAVFCSHYGTGLEIVKYQGSRVRNYIPTLNLNWLKSFFVTPEPVKTDTCAHFTYYGDSMELGGYGEIPFMNGCSLIHFSSIGEGTYKIHAVFNSPIATSIALKLGDSILPWTCVMSYNAGQISMDELIVIEEPTTIGVVNFSNQKISVQHRVPSVISTLTITRIV